MSNLKIVDVGDVHAGMPAAEALANLQEIVAEVSQRGGLPLVLGGSSELAFHAAVGLISACSSPISYLNISPSLDTRVLNTLTHSLTHTQ